MRNLRTSLLLAVATFAATALHAATFTVTNANATGAGSLYQAISDLNSFGTGSNTIVFAAGSGPISIKTQLPTINKPVVIDGTTQPGYSGTPIVEIDGSACTVHGCIGLRIMGGNSTIKGLVVNNYSNHDNVQGLGAAAGISLASGGNSVVGCYIGTDVAGANIKKNDVGIRIENGAHNNSIGTNSSSAATRNLISGNDSGIESDFGYTVSTNGTLIQGNSFGFNAAGAPSLANYWDMYLDKLDGGKIGGTGGGQGNRFGGKVALLQTSNMLLQGNTFGVNGTITWAGISIGYGSGNVIGGTAAGAGNTFVNAPYAWAIEIQDSSSNVIQGNTITGYTVAVGIYEVNYAGSTVGNLVGGTAPGAGNTIRGNTHSGHGAITLVGSQAGTQILGNSIAGSAGTGIDLGDDGHTANDPGDADSGANGLQNYPVLTTVTSGNGTTTIAGSLNSKANSSYRVEFFANTACNSVGYGEGETYLGFTNVTTDGGGNGNFVVTLAGTVPTGRAITATATDPAGNTSEFSACTPVTATGAFQFAPASPVGEGAGNAIVTVSRVSGSLGTATINFATANGTATAGSDYTAVSGTLTFNDGDTSKTIAIPILQDAIYEGNENFSVVLSSPGGGALLVSPSTVLVTIVDDDIPSHATVADIRVTEGNSGTTAAEFTVKLDQPSTNPASVQWTTANGTAIAGSDFTAASGTLNFAAGESQKTISVSVLGDTLYEPDETFSIVLSNPVNLILDRAVAACTIANDDAQPVISADDVSVAEGNSGTTNVTIKLKSSAPLTGSVDYSTADDTARAGSDYTSASGSVTFNNESEKQITVAVTGDTTPEPDERFRVHLSARDGIATFARSDVFVTIVNDDVALLPAVLTIATGQSGNLTADFGNAVTSTQTLPVSKSDACIQVPDSVTIAAGQRSVSFAVNALTGPCSARVDVVLPPVLGGRTLSAGVRTFQSIALTFDPASPQLVVGQSISVVVKANPFVDTMTVALSSASGTVQVPASVEIGANGGTFTMKALRSGAISVAATLPAQYGGATFTLTGNITDPPPSATILDVTPKSGATTGGTPVSISGLSFTHDCTIAFDGIPAADVAYVSTVQLNANTPAHKPGAVDVTVTCGGTASTLKNGFIYTGGSPDIAGIDPASGTIAGGTTVRIAGRDLTSDCWVELGGELARNVVVNGATEMIATTPAHAAGAVTVKLRCGGGAAGALPDGFTYVTSAEPNPVVTGVDPLAAAPGQQVKISGSRFHFTDLVTFGDAAAQVLSTAPDAHVVVVPSLLPGKVSVTVASSTTGPVFTILDAEAPKVTKMSPASVPQGAELTIDGSGFRSPYAFRIGNLYATLISLSFTRAVVRVPGLAPGSYEVDVMSGDTVLTSGGHVTVSTGGLVVTGATPPCVSTDGGASITITGNGFVSGATVTIGGIAAANVKVTDAGHIDARTPALPSGFATIAVTNPSGDNGTATNAVRAYSPLDPDGCAYTPRARPIHR